MDPHRRRGCARRAARSPPRVRSGRPRSGDAADRPVRHGSRRGQARVLRVDRRHRGRVAPSLGRCGPRTANPRRVRAAGRHLNDGACLRPMGSGAVRGARALNPIDVRLVTCASLPVHDPDTPLLAAALTRSGHSVDVVDWRDGSIDWPAAAVTVLRSPWDYVDYREDFLAWAERVSAVSALWNPLELVR